jgi:hypothetical protein
VLAVQHSPNAESNVQFAASVVNTSSVKITLKDAGAKRRNFFLLIGQ